MTGSFVAEQWLQQARDEVEHALAEALPPAHEHPTRLHEAMRYAVLGGGKRVRALLVQAAGYLSSAPLPPLLAGGCAVELIHAYSLVHDDMPCMDDDALRRGQPTVHVRWDEATALLVGDALQSLAFEVLARSGAPEVPRMVVELATAAGSRGMAGGQAVDLAAVGARMEASALEDMHLRKTGALLAASIRLGALCAPQQDQGRLQALDTCGRTLGLAFQVVDDILDVEGSAGSLGKTAGKDAAHDKPTYVSVLGLEPSRRLALRLHEEAIAALAPFGEAAGPMRALADLIVSRKS